MFLTFYADGSVPQFTVRHLANVFQGLLMGTPEVVNT